MFLKDRPPPRYVEALPRLAHRLPAGHPAAAAIPHQLHRSASGFGGETWVDDILLRTPFPKPPTVIRDLYFGAPYPNQIDTLILTASYCLVLEIKNYSGILHFSDGGRRMEREHHDTGERQGFDSPIVQLLAAMDDMRVLLNKIGCPLPVHGAVVLPHARTLVRGDTGGVPVLYSRALRGFISGLPARNVIAEEQVVALGHSILRHLAADRVIDFQKAFKYTAADVLPGVRCSSCGRPAVRVSERLHRCARCSTEFSDGYKRALDDWFDFVKPEISVKECQAFLGMKDRYAARYVLQKHGFIADGSTNKRVYRKNKEPLADTSGSFRCNPLDLVRVSLVRA
ncbi:nuclease-related domain-containing protein [Indiicoccus explosivorum]|uniref:nuclease-related domain-containing protein n=1 Tax=Indiicoccus explosivorum TaxID=1917864 RepID=UPI00138FC69B|nr:nuclease-related domain-containing protein [Indiicoccus explosivorum]